MDRSEHLAWCKKRAIEYVDAGDMAQALASMTSDLGAHPETESSQRLAVQLGMPLLMMGELSTRDQMRKFIDGFN